VITFLGSDVPAVAALRHSENDILLAHRRPLDLHWAD
jgi:hypothetical protein